MDSLAVESRRSRWRETAAIGITTATLVALTVVLAFRSVRDDFEFRTVVADSGQEDAPGGQRVAGASRWYPYS
jgi:hypothetical protein